MEWSLKPSSEYFKSLKPSVQKRITAERSIIRAACAEAIKRGYSVTVFNGEDNAITRSTSLNKIVAALHQTDEDYVIFTTGDKKRIGTLTCIYGNSGWDVISDYSWIDDGKRNTKEIMEAIDKAATVVADKWEKRLD